MECKIREYQYRTYIILSNNMTIMRRDFLLYTRFYFTLLEIETSFFIHDSTWLFKRLRASFLI